MYFNTIRSLLHSNLNFDGGTNKSHSDPWTDFIEVVTDDLISLSQDKFNWEMSHVLDQIVEESYVNS